jgi:uncharacterized delta-60 repeat protein
VGTLSAYHYHGSAVMYQPGKVVVLGGSADGVNGGSINGNAVVETIDLTQGTPAWTTVQPMSNARQSQNATLLADGTVLVSGGHWGPGLDTPDETDSVKIPELWGPDPLNPSQGPAQWQWTSLAVAPVSRVYHTVAVLLPDGRLFSTGGELAAQYNAETFSPPYLFKGPRPVIQTAPAVVNYSQTFTLQTDSADSVYRVNLVRLSSVTHSFNMNQRFNALSFTGGGGSWSVTTPSDPGQCPPGHYLLFVINNVGVPSVAKVVQIMPSSAPQVVMVSPANGGFVQPGSIKVSAQVRNLANVDFVEFLQGQTQIGVVYTPAADGHYAMTWTQTTPGQYTLKARAWVSTTYTESPQTTVRVNSFPVVSTPTLTPPVSGGNYYSFPVTVSASYTDADGANTTGQMELYGVYVYPFLLVRQATGPGSTVSYSYTWPQAHSGLPVGVWASAQDNLGCEAYPSGKANFTIYGGALDTSFAPSSGANQTVYAVAAQSDGKVLIGGAFTTVNGTSRSRIARLNADGSLDAGFNPGADNTVRAITIQPGGKVLVGGDFTFFGGGGRGGIARLNADDTLDSFNPNAIGAVNAIAIQPADGSVLIGGSFTTLGGATHEHIARVSGDGTVDPNFNPSADAAVNAIAVQSGGSIVFGGGFTSVNSTTRNYIARVDGNGGLESFDPGANGAVNAIAVQPSDGKILIGGAFTSVASTTRNHIARLSSNGTLDAEFQSGLGGANDEITCVAVQSDGNIVIGGDFTQVNGVARNRVARLASKDGALDDNFRQGSDPSTLGPNDIVRSIAIDHRNLIVIGGEFTSYKYSLNGQAITPTLLRVARIGGL